MTIIMAFARNADPEKVAPTDNIAVVMADGLASNGRENTPGNQKVFTAGDNYLLGSGAGDKINYVAEQFRGASGITPYQLGQEIIKVSDAKFNYVQGEQLNFLLVGNNKGRIEVYQLATQGIREPMLVKGGVAFDGSGSEFTRAAAMRDTQRGSYSNSRFDTIADLTFYAFDLGVAAMRSAGVNSEFQFGFMTPEGRATLLHPTVRAVQGMNEYSTGSAYDRQKKIENDQTFDSLFKELENMRAFQHDANRLNAIAMSNEPIDRKEILTSLEQKYDDIAVTRKTIEGIICGYVAKYNPNGAIVTAQEQLPTHLL